MELSRALDIIARIVYLECHETQIERGGGSLPEMIAEGLLLSIGGKLSYFGRKNPEFNLWAQSMICDFTLFKKEFLETIGFSAGEDKAKSKDEEEDKEKNSITACAP